MSRTPRTSKKCTSCHVEKPVSCFYVMKVSESTGTTYYHPKCKPCYQAAKDKKKQAEWKKKWKAENMETVRRQDREYSQRHYGKRMANKVIHKRAKQATPPWADRAALAEVYEEAKRLRKHTGGDYVVDHIIPLNGLGVCGLNIAQNLQILTREENMKKGKNYAQAIMGETIEPLRWQHRA